MSYLSTGVLNKHPNTIISLIELVNLDPSITVKIRVKVINWSDGATITDTEFTLHPNTLINFLVFLVNSDLGVNAEKYEIRYHTSHDLQVFINSYGVDNLRANQEGNTVLFKSLNTITKTAFNLGDSGPSTGSVTSL
ncbi:hypothetical protein Q0N30_25845 [Priestia megaterium]|uniref:hypothetical protein n=1 Tax=Priestia megaterium TaxID=1404 RepID=UPI00345AC928